MAVAAGKVAVNIIYEGLSFIIDNLSALCQLAFFNYVTFIWNMTNICFKIQFEIQDSVYFPSYLMY